MLICNKCSQTHRHFIKFILGTFAFFFIFFFPQKLFASTLIKPRTCYVVATPHFDIIYPHEISQKVEIIINNIEEFYNQAKNLSQTTCDIHCTLIISPDSDVLEVTYTKSPYNRIILYLGVQEASDVLYENEVLETLRYQIFIAVTQTNKSSFDNVIGRITNANWYQPISLINLPYSFLQGFTISNESKKFKDGYYLSVISQAKYENKLPTWFECCVNDEVNSSSNLKLAMASAFTAYLQNTYGYEKYLEFWNECGKLHFMKLTNGIFKSVYGTTLDVEWGKFCEQIPLPSELEALEFNSMFATNVFAKDSQSTYKNLVSSEYGLIWYDKIKHEVDIYDKQTVLKNRQLLFMADNIQHLSTSPDGRFLAISYECSRYRQSIKTYETKIYDLSQRHFLKGKYKLKDASFMILQDGTTAVCGVDVSDKSCVLKIFYCGRLNELLDDDLDDDDKQVYSYDFKEQYPYDFNYYKPGYLTFLLSEADKTDVVFLDIEKSNLSILKLKTADGLYIRPKNLIGTTINHQQTFLFNYIQKQDPFFTKMGYFTVNPQADESDTVFDNIYLQTGDFLGGLNTPVVYDEDLYYASYQTNFDTLNIISFNSINFEMGQIEQISKNVQKSEILESEIFNTKLPYRIYSPFKYLFHSTLVPFSPIRDISIQEGVVRWPALGLTYLTGKDPFENSTLILSAGVGFIDFDYTSAKTTTKMINNDLQEISYKTGKNLIMAGFFENTSTPIDIKAGAIFKCTVAGDYNFKWMLGTTWQLPLGMDIQKFTLGAQAENCYATRYYDPLQKEVYPDLYGWPSFSKAYTYFNISAWAEYKNVNVYGGSEYENRGIEIGCKFFSLWDDRKLAEISNNNSAENSQNQERTENLQETIPSFSDYLNGMSQLSLSFWSTIYIPALNPLTSVNDWILSCPTIIGFKLFQENGRALETFTEVLLIGREIHNGISPLYLYFNRAGLKAGYNLTLMYDTNQYPVPDIRNIRSFGNVFANTYLNDRIYFTFDFSFTPVIGQLCTSNFAFEFINSYYLRQNSWTFTLGFSAKI